MKKKIKALKVLNLISFTGLEMKTIIKKLIDDSLRDDDEIVISQWTGQDKEVIRNRVNKPVWCVSKSESINS